MPPPSPWVQPAVAEDDLGRVCNALTTELQRGPVQTRPHPVLVLAVLCPRAKVPLGRQEEVGLAVGRDRHQYFGACLVVPAV
ncbi:MAG: hypothetical protein MI748_12985, partial [Opitutales bacterium]|nr:hypothetical protein [Opitutales bacterium]